MHKILASVLVLVFLGLIPEGYGYGSGAPETACDHMEPQHGVSAQNSQSPYRISATRISDSPTAIRVRIDGATFEGFFLQARLQQDQRQIVSGKFSDYPQDIAQTLACSGNDDSLTHTDQEGKMNLEAIWLPPPGFEGAVVFKGTVLKTFLEFWSGHASDTIYIASPGNAEQLGATRPTTTLLPGTSLSPARAIYSDCDFRKGCVGLPNGCIERSNCQTLMTFEPMPNAFAFDLYDFEPRDNWYSAVGLSETFSMGDTSVTGCINSQVVSVRQSWNQPRDNVPLDNANLGIFDVTAENVDNILHCSWKRDVNTTVMREIFDLKNSAYYVLLARGPAQNNLLRHHREKMITDNPVNFTEISIALGAGVDPRVKAHGTLMIVGWMWFVSIGVILARHYKPVWPEAKPMGVQVWFFLHRGGMIVAISCMIVALILIFVAKGGWNGNNLHAIFGILAFCLAALQPFMAYFRPGASDPKRYIFNWAHFTVGNLGQALAVVAMFLSASMGDTRYLASYIYYPLALYVCLHLFSHLILHLVVIILDNRNKSDVGVLEHGKNIQTDAKHSPPSQNFKSVFLFLYIFVVTLLVAVSVYFIWEADNMD